METENTSSNILVAVRVRPLSDGELEVGHRSCCQTFGGKVVAIRKNGDQGGYLKSQQPLLNEYAFDEVFDDSVDQQEVYQRTAKPFIHHVLDGQNVTVFAYGATGAGKTHTMLGNTRADTAAQNAEGGIIPNAVKDVFHHLAVAQRSKQAAYGETFKIFVSFLEVYNEQVYDLLEPSGRILSVREDKEKGIVAAAGLTEQQVSSYEQVIDHILAGNKRRKTEATMANTVSSRSHAILQLTVKHTVRNEAGREGLIESKLSLIDLAGSERASATNNRGARLQEGANINKSLLALANCINALAENANSKKACNVKYRDSKLTHLLRSSLEGNGHLVMIANLNPSDQTYEDSHNTLKYANRAKNIKVNPAVKGLQMKETSWVEREMRFREENAHLRQTIRALEDKVIELEYFKSTVLANNGILPPDFELIDSVSLEGLPTAPAVVEEMEMDLSMSSLSTAQDVAGDFTTSTESSSFAEAEDDLTKPMHCLSPPRASKVMSRIQARESIIPTAAAKTIPAAHYTPTIPASSTVIASVSMAPVLVMTSVEEVILLEEEPAPEEVRGKKRRASLLPTMRASTRNVKRQSLVTDSGSRFSVLDCGSAPVLAASSPPPPAPPAPTAAAAPRPTIVSRVTNPMAWAAEPSAPPTKARAVPPPPPAPAPPVVSADDDDMQMDWLETSHFELGKHVKPSSAVAARSRRASTANRSSVANAAGARRKSMAEVTAMLDFLQQDVSTPAVAAPAPAPAPTRSATPAAEEGKRGRTKGLHVVDPNVLPAEHKEEVVKAAPRDRRKSVKAAFSVEAVSLSSVNDENAPTALRRSTRRASLSATSARMDV